MPLSNPTPEQSSANKISCAFVVEFINSCFSGCVVVAYICPKYKVNCKNKVILLFPNRNLNKKYLQSIIYEMKSFIVLFLAVSR